MAADLVRKPGISRGVACRRVLEGVPRYWLLVAMLPAVYTYAFIDRVILALLVDAIRHYLGASDLRAGLLLGFGFALFHALLSIPAGPAPSPAAGAVGGVADDHLGCEQREREEIGQLK